jgi:hypothetical protein
MKKKYIFLFIILSIICFFSFRWNNIKTYFIEERYYSIYAAIKIAKPHYKPYKSFYNIFTQEGFNYKTSNQKVIQDSLNKLDTNKEANERSITTPFITHQVYFTPTIKETKLSDFYIENTKLSISKLNKTAVWKHYIWTNNKDIFKSINTADIRSTEEFKDHPLYKNLLEMLDKGNESRAYLAEASDLVRLMALQKFGGMYKDMDYEIYNIEALLSLFNKYDFIGGRERLSIKSYYGNSFLVAKPNHPIINKALENLYRNHHLDKESPTYLNYPSMEFDRIYFNGPPLITIAYFSKNNIDSNNDIILPQWMIYNQEFAHSKNKFCDFSKITNEFFYKNNDILDKLINDFTLNSENKTPKDGKISLLQQNIYYNTKHRDNYPIIGADMFCGSWVAGNNFKRNYYWNIPFLKNEK